MHGNRSDCLVDKYVDYVAGSIKSPEPRDLKDFCLFIDYFHHLLPVYFDWAIKSILGVRLYFRVRVCGDSIHFTCRFIHWGLHLCYHIFHFRDYVAHFLERLAQSEFNRNRRLELL